MLNLNRVTLLGHVGRDPESIPLRNDARAAAFSLATTERWRDKEPAQDGTENPIRERTEWHRVMVFGPAAEVVERRVRKGGAVLVEGRLSTREYRDEDGKTRRATEIVVAGPKGLVNVLDARGAKGNGDAQP